MKKILLVEDNPQYQLDWEKKLCRYEVVINQAFDLEGAQKILDRSDPFDLVVVDGCVPGYTYNTEPFIRELRQKSAMPIVTAAGCFKVQQLMMSAGCSHASRKDDVPDTVIRLLDLQLTQSSVS